MVLEGITLRCQETPLACKGRRSTFGVHDFLWSLYPTSHTTTSAWLHHGLFLLLVSIVTALNSDRNDPAWACISSRTSYGHLLLLARLWGRHSITVLLLLTCAAPATIDELLRLGRLPWSMHYSFLLVYSCLSCLMICLSLRQLHVIKLWSLVLLTTATLPAGCSSSTHWGCWSCWRCNVWRRVTTSSASWGMRSRHLLHFSCVITATIVSSAATLDNWGMRLWGLWVIGHTWRTSRWSRLLLTRLS